MLLALTIPGPPPRKNAKTKVFATRRKGGKVAIGRTLTDEYMRWRDVVALVWDRKRARERLRTIEGGRWEIVVRAFWERARHLDSDFAFGDVDAPLECVLDALQFAKVIDDDVRFVRLEATKHHDAAYPRVEVEIREAAPEGQLPLYTPTAEERDDF